MTAALLVAAGAVAACGLCLVIVGLLPLSARVPRVGPPIWDAPSRRWRQLSPARRRLILLGLGAGAVAALVTRWIPALVVVPLLVVVLPYLLADPENREIEVLEALDRWVRGLTASLLTGRSVVDAIRSTRQQAPPAINEAVMLLAARLDERWPLPEAMAGFADDVDHADADAVAAALIVAGQRGTGAAATLEALADAVQDRLVAAREMDNERAKPRIVVRQVTAITGVVLALALVTSPAYFAPYRTGFGPWIATALVAIYLGALAKLRAASRPEPRARIRLGAPDDGSVANETSRQ